MKSFQRFFMGTISFGIIASFCFTALPSSIYAAKKKKTSFTTTEINDSFYDKAWRNFQIGSKKERKDVITALKAVVRKNPEEFMANYYLGIMTAEEDSPTSALRYFQTALAGFPKSADIHIRIAKILDEKGKYEEALEHYQKALEIEPVNGAALSRVGIAELEMGNNDEAYDLLFKARQAQPDNPDTLRSLGAVMIERGEIDEAVKVLDQALMFDQKHAETHWLIGKAFEKQRKPGQASEHFELAKKYGRTDSELKELIGYDLARSLMRSGKYKEAEKEYKKTIKISEDPGTGYYELALLYGDIGQDDSSIKNFWKAYEMDRQFGEGLMKSAEIYMKREDYARAEEIYQVLKKDKKFKDQAKQAIEELRDREELNEKLKLEARIEDGRANDAVLENTYFEMLDYNKKDENALKGLWEFYEERGYYQEALVYFRKYNKLNPVSDFQKKLTEKELKNKLKLDNYIIFNWKKEIDFKSVPTSKDDLLQQAYNGENDRVKELAFQVLTWRIAHRKKDRSMSEDKPIVEGMLEFYEERGRLQEALKCVSSLKRYGWWSDYEAKDKRRELREDLK